MDPHANLIMPHWPGLPASVGAISTLRTGGVSGAPYDDGAGGGGFNLGMHVGDDPESVRRNRAQLSSLLPNEPAWLNQVHGTTVVNAAETGGGCVPTADASIATELGIVCVIQTADCLPVLLCDADGQVVGAAHAGWRGLAAGVLENTVARMRAAGAGELIAWLGPAIGPARFEVGAEVREAFMQGFAAAESAFTAKAGVSDKYLADIYQLARLVLLQQGVAQICGGDFCTVSEPERFYSYRRDRITGRMASLIWRK